MRAAVVAVLLPLCVCVAVATAYKPAFRPDTHVTGRHGGAHRFGPVPHPDPFLRGTWAHVHWAFQRATDADADVTFAAELDALLQSARDGTLEPAASSSWTVTNVSFPSAAVPSGQITLNGAFVAPSPAPSTPVRLVVLISGSGPNDRWESLPGTGLRVFYDVATALAATGQFAVLTYDKRECAFIPGLCPGYVACSATHPPGSGCVLFSAYSLDDLVSDAQTALQYAVATFPDVVRGDHSAVALGHSQGCAVAPLVANALPSLVRDVVLLMGGGVPLDVLLSDQGLVQTAFDGVQLQYWTDQPDTNPNKATAVTYYTQAMQLSECEGVTATPQLDLLRLGMVQPQDNAAICPFGYPWHGDTHLPAGNYCPGVCSTLTDPLPQTQGVVCDPASAWATTNATCLLQCQYGYALEACWTPRFAASWLAACEPDASLAALKAVNGRIYAVNSMADLLVVPPAFFPLHTALTALNGTGAGSGTVTQTRVQLYSNLTHDLVVQYSSDEHVYAPLLTALNEWLLS